MLLADKEVIISFEATALLFFYLLIIIMSIDFSSRTLGKYATCLLDFLMNLPDFLMNHQVFQQNTVFATVVAGLTTGLGIVLGNLIINSFKYKNLIEDISKVFDLVVSSQITDLYNIRMTCESIRNRWTTHGDTIIDLQKNIVVRDRSIEERRGLLKDTAIIKDREITIKNDDLYKGKLYDVKLFKSDNLEFIVRYFRKLKVILEDLRNFAYYELPSNIDECDTFNWRLKETYIDRSKFLIARINIVICLGLMTKCIFKRFDTQAQKNFGEVYKLLLNLQEEIQDSRNMHSLLKEDFDIIQDFAQKSKIEFDKPAA